MDFSETYRTSLGLPPKFSPDGRFIATAVEYRLIIRETETLRVVQLYSCLDRISAIDWSFNSQYVLCGLFSRGIVQVWSVDQPEWACRIDEGPAGISAVRWHAEALSILVVADFSIRTTVWSLQERSCTYLKGPKLSGDTGLVFSPDARHLAVLERVECKDQITVYDARTWAPACCFSVETSDAAGVSWSPDGSHLAVWESPLEYSVLLYTAAGVCVGRFSAYQGQLGIKTVSWSSNGDLMAIGSYDQVARVVNNITWQPLLEAPHATPVTGPANVVVYREETVPEPGTSGGQGRSQYSIANLPAPVPSTSPPLDKAGPRLGVGRCCWSPDSQFLASVNDNMPGAVWVWDMVSMELAAVLVHGPGEVDDMAWAPRGSMLAVVCGGSKVYMWTPQGASIVHAPLSAFQAHGCKWNGLGTTLLLTDKEAFCCAYLTA